MVSVWVPVVWIPGIPENERECYLKVPLESQTTGPQMTNWSLADLCDTNFAPFDMLSTLST